jgi:hypothetical protein
LKKGDLYEARLKSSVPGMHPCPGNSVSGQRRSAVPSATDGQSSAAGDEPGVLARSSPPPAQQRHQQQAPASPSQDFHETLIPKQGFKTKKGSLAAPLLVDLLCRLGSAQNARMFLERHAPQKRCDQLWCSSKPGGVMFPPELDELTPRLYSWNSSNASEELVNSLE